MPGQWAGEDWQAIATVMDILDRQAVAAQRGAG